MKRLILIFLVFFPAYGLPLYAIGTPSNSCVYLEADFIQKQLSQTQTLLNNIRLQPRFKNTQAWGHEILFIRKDSDISQLKLQENDIITQLENRPFTNNSNLADALAQLPHLPEFTLTLLRDETELTMRYISAYDVYCD
jgi:type II secretory pathway component PulC